MHSLDHLDCSLAVFYMKNIISGIKFLSQSMKAVVRTCACTISLGHFDFRMYLFGSHSRNQDQFTVSLFKTEVHLPIFRGSCSNLELMQILLIIWIAVWQFFASGSKFLSSSMKAVVGTCSCAISLDHLDLRLFMFGSHSYSKSG